MGAKLQKVCETLLPDELLADTDIIFLLHIFLPPQKRKNEKLALVAIPSVQHFLLKSPILLPFFLFLHPIF